MGATYRSPIYKLIKEMKDTDCIQFLQWALPKLEMRWPGFRKVHRHVCKRINRRITELGLSDTSAYRCYLDAHPEEWVPLDSMCRITISRFYRDRGVFSYLENEVLPEISEKANARGDRELRCWSIGCASGEEAYTLSLLWEFSVKPGFPSLDIRIVGTDVDAKLIGRAEVGCYPPSSVKELPKDWLERGFYRLNDRYCLYAKYRANVELSCQDIRLDMPTGSFFLILCRNLVFTYFNDTLQRKILKGIGEMLVPGGILVTGTHESLPAGADDLFVQEAHHTGIYKRSLPS